MQPRNSPLDHLAAFAIVFAAGVLSATSLAAYIARVRRHPTANYFKPTKQTAQFSPSPLTRRSVIE